MATNEYGLDTRYMSENLSRLLRDIERYTPEEMQRALIRLADVAVPSSRSSTCYLPGSMPTGWGLRRHEAGKIVVTHTDGSGVQLSDDADSISETMFYRMMNDVLVSK